MHELLRVLTQIDRTVKASGFIEDEVA